MLKWDSFYLSFGCGLEKLKGKKEKNSGIFSCIPK